MGRPSRDNCGACHFYGGGGDGVKHGDLDSPLQHPARSLDVHMASKDDGGQGFTCVRRHTTRAHDVAGRIYSSPAVVEVKSLVEDDLQPKIACESCHTATPHDDAKLNDHTDRVACQACHIPTFARALPTKMRWDWSKAGDKARPPVRDANGKPDYDPKKGEFVWGKEVVPDPRVPLV